MTEQDTTYASGEHPKAGDLIEYGTRNIRLIVSQVIEEANEFYISCDGHRYPHYTLRLMKLIARHGCPEPKEDIPPTRGPSCGSYSK